MTKRTWAWLIGAAVVILLLNRKGAAVGGFGLYDPGSRPGYSTSGSGGTSYLYAPNLAMPQPTATPVGPDGVPETTDRPLGDVYTPTVPGDDPFAPLPYGVSPEAL
jgi:hypothetical protein